MIIHEMFALNRYTGFRGEILEYFPIGSYVKTISADGSYLEFPNSTRNINFVEVHPMIVHAMFALNRFTGFRVEIFFTFSQRVLC